MAIGLLKNSAVINSLSGMVAGLARPLVSFLTLPFLARAIGPELLGFWMMALSVAAIFGCLNAGISAAVVTLVGRGEHQTSVVRHGLVLALSCSLIAVMIGIIAISLIDFHELFNLSNEIDPKIAQITIALLFLALALGFPGQIGRFVAIGRREGYRAQGIEMISLIAASSALIFAIAAGEGFLSLATAFLVTPPLVVLVLTSGYLHRLGLLTGIRGKVDLLKLRSMSEMAVPMAGHQGLMATNQHGDVLIVGALLGPVDAALYGVGQRICALANYFVTPINHALWPELTALTARSEILKLKRYFWIQISITMAFSVTFAVLFLLFGNWIISFWLGDGYEFSFYFLSGLGLGVIAFTLVTTLEASLKAEEQFNFLLRCTSVAVPLGIGAKVLAAIFFNVEAVAWAGPIALLLIVGLPYAFRLKFLAGGSPQ